MSGHLRPLDRLFGAQLHASDPRDLVWLSASAGTGKTHVLTARVMRLLLHGVRPESILCLTFTKAGAAEMADRIHARLAHWVRLDAVKLAKELFALGEPHDPDAVARARTLFARVLEAPGGGLRIQTIHAFCQTLLAGFPAEAGLTPGFRPLDGRQEAALARRTLAELLERAERGGDLSLIVDVQALSRRLGEGKAESYLMLCARHPEAMAALGPRQGIEARLRTALSVPLGDVEQAIEAACADDRFDCAGLRRIAAANAAWGTKTGLADADRIAAFLAAAPRERALLLADLISVALTKAGEPRSFSQKLIDCDADYAGLCARFADAARALLGLRERAALAALLACGLRAGQSYSAAYAEAKRIAGLVDFDDLIRSTVDLLGRPGTGEWVRYKLDQRTDHILVDEAQDTNASQWAIIAALAGEFFTEEPGEETRPLRTIFSVGDFKQAIFGFQGTDPRNFEAAQLWFDARARDAGRVIHRLSLDRSFRSTPPILAVVDRLIEDIGADRLGLVDPAEPHRSAREKLPGTVSLWRPISADLSGDLEDEGEEGWVDDATRTLANRLARQIRLWLDDGLMLEGRGRPLRPEDILVLVRKRGALPSLLVARLHAEKVPVAGVDRLRLDQPLAVRDLLAAIRFALQPEDDLTLASLLVSPLFGLSQDDLYCIGHRRNASLWASLRHRSEYRDTAAGLNKLLNQADLVTPYRFLENLLSGPLDARRKLLRRLGPEARDPIEELLNAALSFEADATPTLQRFLDWFDRGEVEITRDPSAPLDAVRVMTVHGAKGLQAPLVILADATADPDASRADSIHWSIGEDGPTLPVFRPRKAELAGSLTADLEAARIRERAEHWRLLYVALTRAEEWLVVAGALGPRARGVPPQESWYQAVDAALDALGAGLVDDPLWTAARHYRGEGGTPLAPRVRTASEVEPSIAEPEWLRRPAPHEARPPRPLAPSSLGPDDVADPPPTPALLDAARRGRLLHALFERLPAVAPDDRIAAADRWLQASAGVEEDALRKALIRDACAIIADPALSGIFGPDSLAEAPIAAVVGGTVVAGTVDRLLVTDDRVQVVDFKTGRRVPRDAASAPEHHLRQMAAYVGALEIIFPGRQVEAALLYTSGPTLFSLPSELIARYKSSLADAEQKLLRDH
ncbi:double-strand break repair helicase AddA [Sphingomonas oleivorans]|uniref:DNA 3'-5' helicase n=1 Tax=Sphingomonas oleivorans TaxID=1735121 RepID=A0A2T5FTL4_9SPHN|nr:double-strand break repair helicase AddA [Sphingomonas oleivorans]PTQ07404.1 double-strand break repair helicase AddA [Sphingomonas oleivorans]